MGAMAKSKRKRKKKKNTFGERRGVECVGRAGERKYLACGFWDPRYLLWGLAQSLSFLAPSTPGRQGVANLREA